MAPFVGESQQKQMILSDLIQWPTVILAFRAHPDGLRGRKADLQAVIRFFSSVWEHFSGGGQCFSGLCVSVVGPFSECLSSPEAHPSAA